MNTELVQHLRFKLQKRVRRLNATTHYQRYHYFLKQFWHFLEEDQLFWGILEDLRMRQGEMEEVAEEIISREGHLAEEIEESHVGVAYFLIEHCVENTERDTIWRIANGLTPRTSSGNFNESVANFHEQLVEPLYEYIDEHLDDQRALLHLLRRYKHRCEWFERAALHELWKSDTQQGEKRLAQSLYEYLYDQGIDFSIEPASASGEADLVTAQQGEDRLVADAKIFHSGSGKHYLAKGVRQIYDYTQDYNEPFGYLVVYKVCPESLNFALSGVAQSTPYLLCNNKTLFVVTVDIYPYEDSASKRGKLKTIEVSENYLLDVVESEGQAISS